MTKVYVKVVPENVTQERKDNQFNIFSDIMERFIEPSDVHAKIITYDETWIFQYECQWMH